MLEQILELQKVLLDLQFYWENSMMSAWVAQFVNESIQQMISSTMLMMLLQPYQTKKNWGEFHYHQLCCIPSPRQTAWRNSLNQPLEGVPAIFDMFKNIDEVSPITWMKASSDRSPAHFWQCSCTLPTKISRQVLITIGYVQGLGF